MCTNRRWIYNPYAKRSVLVSCGKCEACLQEKACSRSNRIRHELSSHTIALFITLTYTNDFVPFIYEEDIDSFTDINIYRRCSGRYVFDRHSGRLRFRKSYGIDIIDTKSIYELMDTTKYPDETYFTPALYKHLVGLPSNYIGVPYYEDAQNFFKRLRIILDRHYGFKKYFSYFCTCELGGHTFRPHFHALLFIRPDDEATFRSAILEAWPYADSRRTKKYIEIAKDAASYVSSYVNSPACVLPLFKTDTFRPKHSQSKNFGAVLDCFSLTSILEKIERGDLYYYSAKKFDGDSTVNVLPIPLYILNRYFPKHKGFGWLSDDVLAQLLLCPEKSGFILRDAEVNFKYSSNGFSYRLKFNSSPRIGNPLYHYSCKETYHIYVSLENAFKRFHAATGLSRWDYAYYYIRAWRVSASNHLIDQYKDIDSFDDWSEFYDNSYVLEPDSPCHLKHLYLLNKIAPTLKNCVLHANFNLFSRVTQRTNKFKSLYYKLDKQKKVSHYVMAKNGHNV